MKLSNNYSQISEEQDPQRELEGIGQSKPSDDYSQLSEEQDPQRVLEGFGQIKPSDDSSQIWEEQDLQREFGGIIYSTLSAANILLTPDVNANIEALIARGVEGLGNEGDVEKARTNIKIFAVELVNQMSDDIYLALRDSDDGDAFGRTLARLCPLYPFC